MTEQNKEMMDTFEVMYNNITSNQAPGLDVYEISLLLTQAQEELVKNRFASTGNKKGEGIDDSVKRQADFSTLIKVVDCGLYKGTSPTVWKHSGAKYFYFCDEEVFLPLNEQCVINNNTYVVIPIDHVEYDRLMQKPYKYPLKGQVWKLIGEPAIVNIADDKQKHGTLIELIGKFPKDSEVTYQIRYVRRPRPIILEDLASIDSDLRIRGKCNESTCELPKHLFDEIIQRAVELAKAAWQGDLSTTIQIGDRKE